MLRRIALCLLLMTSTAVVVTASPAAADDARLVAYLTGTAERPGPGDPDAIGRAQITITDATNQLCLTLQWARVDGTLSGLHIHVAPPTAAGPIVVPFTVPAPTPLGPPEAGRSGRLFQCVTVANEALLDNIAANPQQYYINLHSVPQYPAGAIRGQLQHP